jgi:hypothetical protein
MEKVRAGQRDDANSFGSGDPMSRLSQSENGNGEEAPNVTDGSTSSSTESPQPRAQPVKWNVGMMSFTASSFLVSNPFQAPGYTDLSTQALLRTYVPSLQTLPIFGSIAATTWGWAIDMSPAYVGYGMIMQPLTTAHMLLGAVIVWAVLSPIAKTKGWAPGPIDDWETGNRGWTIWVSLGVILGDSLVGVCWILVSFGREELPQQYQLMQLTHLKTYFQWSTARAGSEERVPFLTHSNSTEQPSLSNSGNKPYMCPGNMVLIQPHAFCVAYSALHYLDLSSRYGEHTLYGRN